MEGQPRDLARQAGAGCLDRSVPLYALPAHSCHDSTVTRQALIEITRRLLDADGSEAELDGLLDSFERSVPHPTASDLIFHPPEGIPLSPEEIVDLALAYVPTPLAQLFEPEASQ